MPPIDYEQLARIVGAAVMRNLPLFAAFRDVGYEDLMQEGLVVAARQHETFDPNRAMYATWITLAVDSHLRTIARGRRLERAVEDETADGEKATPTVDPETELTPKRETRRGRWKRVFLEVLAQTTGLPGRGGTATSRSPGKWRG